MPFISKDWRSPGEEWVKYDGGWERKSIITTVDNVNNPKIQLDLIQLDLIQPGSSNKAFIEIGECMR